MRNVQQLMNPFAKLAKSYCADMLTGPDEFLESESEHEPHINPDWDRIKEYERGVNTTI